jgi:hypothetical protein
MVALPGIAAAVASRALGQTRDSVAANNGVVSHLNRKVLAKHSGLKSAYKVPKSAAKQAKYVNSLTALLSLSVGQQQQAATILANAAVTNKQLHINLKAARKALSDAVQANDAGTISQASAALGTLTGQHISNGALANAMVFQLLTTAQQGKLAQFQSAGSAAASTPSSS